MNKLFLALCALLLVASAEAITVRFDQPIKTYSNTSFGPNHGFTYLQSAAPTWNYENYARNQVAKMGVCVNRIDIRRNRWWNNATQSWMNNSGPYLQIGNASAVKEEVKYNVETLGCKVILVDNEMPNALATSNTSICNAAANDTRCTPANHTLDAQNRYNIMEFLSPGGIYDDMLYYEVRNEINYPAFYAPNIGESGLANTELRARLAWQEYNATCLQNFSVSRPNLKCGINFVYYWEKSEHSYFLNSFMRNFTTNGRLPDNGFLSVHLYLTDTFMNQAKFINATNNYTRNGYDGMRSVLDDIMRTCVNVTGNASYCWNEMPIVNSEFAFGQQDETEMIKTQNLTYSYNAYEKEIFMMRYAVTQTPINLTNIWYQGPDTSCYTVADQYPLYWAMYRIGLSCTTPPSQNIGTINWTTYNVTVEFSDFFKSGGTIFNVSQRSDVYGYAQNNTNGSVYLYVTSDNGSSVKVQNITFSGRTVLNITDVDNGTVFTASSNVVTVSLPINDTRRYLVNLDEESPPPGPAGPYWENFTNTTVTVTANFSRQVRPINASTLLGVNVNQNPLVPNGCIDTNDDGSCDAAVNYTFHRLWFENSSLRVVRKDVRGHILADFDNVFVENFDSGAICSNKTSGNAWVGTTPYQWLLSYDSISGSAGTVCRSSNKSASLPGVWAAVINNTGTGNISVGETVAGTNFPPNGSSYTFSMWVSAASGAGRLEVTRSSDAAVMCNVSVSGTAWTRYNCSFTPSTTPANYLLYLHAAPGASLIFDEVDTTLTGGTETLHSYLTSSNNDFVNYGAAVQLADYCWNGGNPICAPLFTMMDMPDAYANWSTATCNTIRNCPSVRPDKYGQAIARLGWSICGNGTYTNCLFQFENEPDSATYYASSACDNTPACQASRAYWINRDYDGYYNWSKVYLPNAPVFGPGFAQPWVGGDGRVMHLSFLGNFSSPQRFDGISSHSYYPSTFSNLTDSADTFAVRVSDLTSDCLSILGQPCRIMWSEFNHNGDDVILEDGRSSFISTGAIWSMFLNRQENLTAVYYRWAQRNALTDANAEYPGPSRRRELVSEPALSNAVYQTYYVAQAYARAVNNMTFVVNSTPSNAGTARSVAVRNGTLGRIVVLPAQDNRSVNVTFTLHGGTFTLATRDNGTDYTVTANSFTAPVYSGQAVSFDIKGSFDTDFAPSGNVTCSDYIGFPITCFGTSCFYTAAPTCGVSYARPATIACYGNGVCS